MLYECVGRNLDLRSTGQQLFYVCTEMKGSTELQNNMDNKGPAK